MERTKKPGHFTKIVQILNVLLIGGILLALGVLHFLCPDRSYSERENRNLAQFPPVSGKKLMSSEWEREFETYLNDQFPARDQSVGVQAMYQYICGKREIHKVYLAKNNRLIEKYSDSDFDDVQIQENIQYLKDFLNQASKGLGKDHVRMVFIPSKQTVFSDDLPPFAVGSKKQKEMKDHVRKAVKNSSEIVLDLEEELAKHTDEYIYFRTDHHWTTEGAMYGYRALMQSLTPDETIVLPEETKIVCTDFLGTTYNKIHLFGKADEIEVKGIPSAEKTKVDLPQQEKKQGLYVEEKLKTEDKYSYFMGGNYGLAKIHTPTKNGKKLFMIKDSYSNALLPYLTQNYESIWMTDLRYANESVFTYLEQMQEEENEITDLVILYNEEKFMQDSHQYNLS